MSNDNKKRSWLKVIATCVSVIVGILVIVESIIIFTYNEPTLGELLREALIKWLENR